VIFGIIVGLIGHFIHKKYKNYGYALFGAGFGIIYLSIYAAYSFYAIFSIPIVFSILALLVILGVALSIWYDSLALNAYAFTGAFIIPLILPVSTSIHIFFSYFLVLNVGLLLVARYKTWPQLTAGALIATGLASSTWVLRPETQFLKTETYFYLSVIFFIFTITTIVDYVRRNTDYKSVDSFLLYSVPTIYIFLNAPIIEGKYSWAMFLYSLGIFYVLCSSVIRKLFCENEKIITLSNIQYVFAATCCIAASALYFEGNSILIFWALESLVVFTAGIYLSSLANRVTSLILVVLVVFRLWFFDGVVPTAYVAIFNERALNFLIALVPLLVIWLYYKYSTETQTIKDLERKTGVFIGAVGLFILPFFWMTSEILTFVTDHPSLYLPLVWTGFITLMSIVSFVAREKIFRYTSYITILITVVTILGVDWKLPLGYYNPVLNIRTLSVMLVVLVIALIIWFVRNYESYISETEKTFNSLLIMIANGMLLWLISFEILDYFNKQIDISSVISVTETIESTKRVVLSIAWLAYAATSITFGIIKRSVFARYLSVILFGVTVLKIFLYDTANLSDVYRFISFISLGVILLISGYAYYRFQNRILQFVKVDDNKSIL